MTFGSLLIANRGEIARRVISSARGLGLFTVAVYSDADRTARHVVEADTAVRIGAAPAGDSYLSIAAVIDAARRSGAGAIHPGYGFLSENADFARACVEAGIVFVGPSAAVIQQMGRKDAGRRVAVDSGVPVVPAVEGDVDDLPSRVASGIGFPALVKATAGGGGKGMRVVRTEEELAGALAGARREAAAAFGDASVFVERLIERGRHVEVQLLGDGFGNLVHLFERDCSVQRRHQKVIEEAPAPTMTDSMRERLYSWALSIGRRVGYESAGTVEFLVGGDEAYFLEMNTRLQVEHPVTEAVTGLDIVALQLEIAQGRRLPFEQSDLRCTGHAIEARVYAEDPAAGFAPQAGTPSYVRLSPRARVDGSVAAGEPVGTSYDPMLAKIIVHGPTREAARRSLVAALDDSAIFGLSTNLGFLRRIVASEHFADATIDTGWLDATEATVAPVAPDPPFLVAAFLVARSAAADGAGEPFGPDGWRLGAPCAPVWVEFESEGARRVAFVDLSAGLVTVEGRSTAVVDAGTDAELARVELDGDLVELPFAMDAHRVTIGYEASAYSYTRPGPLDQFSVTEASDGTVVSPMPGVVLSVEVSPGAEVERGAVLGAVESMKMELVIRAPLRGTVIEVAVAPGDRVGRSDRLFVIAGAAV